MYLKVRKCFAWNSLLKPSIACFAWKLFHNRLPTNDWAQSIGVQLASSCCLYGKLQESAYSLFFLCPFALIFWDWFQLHGDFSAPAAVTVSSLWSSLSASSCSKSKKGLGALFLVALFSLWKARNLALFNDMKPSQDMVTNFLMADASHSLGKMTS